MRHDAVDKVEHRLTPPVRAKPLGRLRAECDELDVRALARFGGGPDDVAIGSVQVDRLRGELDRRVPAVLPPLGLTAPLDVLGDSLQLRDGGGAQLRLGDDAPRLVLVQVLEGLIELDFALERLGLVLKLEQRAPTGLLKSR